MMTYDAIMLNENMYLTEDVTDKMAGFKERIGKAIDKVKEFFKTKIPQFLNKVKQIFLKIAAKVEGFDRVMMFVDVTKANQTLLIAEKKITDGMNGLRSLNSSENAKKVYDLFSQASEDIHAEGTGYDASKKKFKPVYCSARTLFIVESTLEKFGGVVKGYVSTLDGLRSKLIDRKSVV